MKFRILLMAVAFVAVLCMPALAGPEPGSNIRAITYSCPSNGETDITIQFTDGTMQRMRGQYCSDTAVAATVAAELSIGGYAHRALVEGTSREVLFSESPGSWLGTNWLRVLLSVAGGVFGICLLFTNIFVVRQQEVYIIERLGKYSRTATAGLNVKIPFIESVVEEFNLRQQQEPVEVDTKTADNVFLEIGLAVQYKVVDPRKAFYELADFTDQLKSYVFDEVRSAIPGMTFDEVFQNKENLAEKVRQALTDKMSEFGYQIIDVLVTDITPPEEIENAMNQVVTQKRLREAATEKGEADKVITVKAAEAQRDRDKLHGEGIAMFRKALAHGIKESMDEVKAGAPGLSDDQVSALLLTTQYFDTLKEVAGKSNSNTIFLPSGPDGGQEVFTQMTAALSASKHGKNGQDKKAPSATPPATPAAPAS